jgi:hypothetical protein
MTNVTHIKHTDRNVLLARKIDDELLRVRGLVLVRDLLAKRGATAAEVEAHTDELERARHDLALIIGGARAEAPGVDEAA